MEFKTIKLIQNLKKLEDLHIGSLKNKIDDLELLNGFPKLQSLSMSNAPWLQDVNFFDEGRAIVSLRLKDCDSLIDLSGVSTLSKLINLTLDDCDALVDFSGLNRLPKLKNLSFKNCDSIETLAVFKTITSLPKLTNLDLTGCSNFQSCDGIEHLPTLTILDITNTGVKKLSPKHPTLQILMALGCTDLEDFDASGLGGINTLHLSNCKSLKTVRGLNGLQSLEDVNLGNCESLETIGVLSDLPTLFWVDLTGCCKIKKLRVIYCHSLLEMDVSSISALEELWIEDCHAYPDPEDFEIKNRLLKKLTLKNCRLSQEQADLLRKRLPEVEFVYEPSH